MDSKPSSSQKSEETDGFAELPSAMLATSTRWLKNFFPNLRDAGIRWSEDDASSMAASVAYYLALSLFPMMLLLISGIGLFLQFSNLGRDARFKILLAVEQQASPVVKQQIEQLLNQVENQSVVSGPFGIATAILAAIGVFAQIDRGFDRIFRIPSHKESSVRRTIYRVVRHRVLAFLMLVCLGGTILVLFASTMIVSQLRSVTGETVPSLKHAFGLFDQLFAVFTNAFLFSLVYRWLPKKRVAWTDAMRGGLLAALVWEAGRTVLGVFLIGMRYTSAYGALGSFIAILLWCYYGISILFFGAEYVQVLEVRRQRRNDANPSRKPTTEELPSLHLAADSPVYHRDLQVSKMEVGREDVCDPMLASTFTDPPTGVAIREDSYSESGRLLAPIEVSGTKVQPRRTT